MALIKCSECGKEISDKSDKCINCGCPVNATKQEENRRDNNGGMNNVNNVVIHSYSGGLNLIQPIVEVFKGKELLVELGPDDDYKTSINEDCILTIVCNENKEKVNILKDKLNEINIDFDKKKDELIVKNNVSENKNRPVGGGLITAICIIVISTLFGGLLAMNNLSNNSSSNNGNDDSKQNISGCYYMSERYIAPSGTKICIYSNSVIFYFGTSSYNLYPKWVGETLYIENNYKENMFRCVFDRNNSNNIKCSSNNNILGTGSFEFNKK